MVALLSSIFNIIDVFLYQKIALTQQGNLILTPRYTFNYSTGLCEVDSQIVK